MSNKVGPKILVFDIETSYMKFRGWNTGEQYVRQDQVIEESTIISWAAKWVGEDKVMYMDLRKGRNKTNSKKMMKGLWDLLDEADIIVTKNGKRFDEKWVNTLFEEHGLGKPSSYKHQDVEKIVRKHFRLPGYSLDYLSNKFNKKYKKLKHSKYPGNSLWEQCLEHNNQDAWKEMEKYNKHDVLSTDELYVRFQPWDNSINFNVYYSTKDNICGCGSKEFIENGHSYTSYGKYKRFKCKECKRELKAGGNQLSLEKRKNMLRKV